MSQDADILIVGLGPVGAVLAGLLARAGLSVIVADRETAPYALPRAATFDDEAMRVFQSLGIAEEVAALCRVPERLEFVTGGGEVLMDFPVREAPTVSGWRKNYLLHQPHVEQALRRSETRAARDHGWTPVVRGYCADSAVRLSYETA